MIAEICGKISSSGSNLSDRLEDNLTGDVFGSLRYIPFCQALKPILVNSIYPKSLANFLDSIQAEYWDNYIKFWPYDYEGEIDTIIEFDDTIIGIEVKYLSGLSSDDAADYSEQFKQGSIELGLEKSQHQLSREARIIDKRGGTKNKVLIFIASSSSCRSVYDDTIRRNLISRNVELGYISWQKLYDELQCLHIDNEFHRLIINDLINLLKKKGFEQFRDMNIVSSYPVNSSCYFTFAAGSPILFDFQILTVVEGDLYYEFR